jgi:phage terminase small subunit
MIQRGRKSDANLSTIAIEGQSNPPVPPASLSEPERVMFVDIVAGCSADHFRKPELPLLSRYCEAACLAAQAAHELRTHGAVVDGKVSPWIVIQEKQIRAMVSLSMRLRLAPQSRIDPKTLGRSAAHDGPFPWE